VPARHEQADQIPAVSGSSGHLHVQRPPAADPGERTWPGRVFEDPGLTYEEAMLDFVAASQERENQAQGESQSQLFTDQAAARAAKRALCGEERELRDARREVREKRKLEDAAWRELRAQRKAAVQAHQALSKEERRRQDEAQQAQDAQWRAARAQRRARMAARRVEDEAWREARRLFRERWAELPAATVWIAILVVIDNCTRQCLGLPLFVAGVHVTAEVVAEALYALLPPELRFLISDRGTHFTAHTFKQRILSETFIHVYTARHRPESNGIAERFVRTLKEWLETQSWADDQALAALLQLFHEQYNDRPHQGLAIPGLSPNEFAKRIWLL
jgi:transposase InsO family protein